MKDRFISLDVLRGLTVAGMILVNSKGVGDTYACLSHSSWDGCTLADFVFPFFLFIVGAAIRFAMKKNNYELNSDVAKKVLKRGCLIFLIGFLLNIFPFTSSPDTWRIMGVLQRIAIVYIIATLLVLKLKSFRNIMLACVGILLGYWALLGLGGASLDDNLIKTVDSFLFGDSHLYGGFGVPFDPEGLMSSVPAICNALFGYLASMILMKDGAEGKVPYKLFLLGIVLLVLSLVWDIVHPLNKALWSGSFVLFTCGWAMVVWFFFFYIIDIKKKKSWTPFFLVFGTNALFSYILSQLLSTFNWIFPFTIGEESYNVNTWLDEILFIHLTTSPMRAVLWGITMVMVCWGITYLLYRKRIYIKL